MNYLPNILVKRQALSDGFDDGIILNEKEEVTECSSSNLLFVKDDIFFTPHRECGLLFGTTLQTLMDKLKINEVRVKVEDLFKYSSIFVLNTLIGILPVCSVMDKKFSYDKKLLDYLNSLIEEENNI